MKGFVVAHSDMKKAFYNPNYLVRYDAPIKGKVSLVSGGGSGHEPMHSGNIGEGMLDATCLESVFTCPTPDKTYKKFKAVDGGERIIHIMKNYPRDILNFEMADDLLRVDGIEVESVVIDNDVAVKDSSYTAGKRGGGATVIA